MNGKHILGHFWPRDLWGRRNYGCFEDDRRTSRGACAPRRSNHESREVLANSTAQRPAASMEPCDQSHRAPEPEWPERLNEWDRPVPASRLTMPCWRCAEAESRRAEMAEPRRLNEAYLGTLLVPFAPPESYYQKEAHPLSSNRRRRQRLADRWIAIFKALPDQSFRRHWC
jgi:hypothetical protein